MDKQIASPESRVIFAPLISVIVQLKANFKVQRLSDEIPTA